MAKQTFTSGQVLTAAQMTSLQQTAMLGGDTTAKSTSYVLTAADAGTVVAMNSSGSTTITVNTSIFSAGDIVTIQNRGTGTCTVTAGTATVNTSGSLVLAQYQGGVLYFNSASAAVFYQFATPASGDIEGVLAGTGISGGGTSGTVTITNSMATEITAAGDIIIGTGSGTFDNLPIGTTGQVLTADTTVSPYKVKWASAGGGGKVLQVVMGNTNTAVTVASSTFADSGLTATITPSATSSKVLVLAMQQLYSTNDPTNATWCKAQLVRGSTSLFSSNRFFGYRAGASETREITGTFAVNWLDSPSTTSATTYKVQIAALTATSNGEVKGQYDSSTSSIILLEIGA